MKKLLVLFSVFAWMATGVHALILLEDDFNGAVGVAVPGNAPDTLVPALLGNVWEGSASVTYDGSSGIIGALNSYRAVAFNISGAYTSTNVLRITAVLQNDESQWAAIGFATNASANGLSDNVGWVNINGDAAGTPGGGALREGPATSGSSSSLTAGLWNTGTTNTVVIEYDLNDDGDGDGTLRAFVNGTLAATVTDTSAMGSPAYIHLAFNNGGGITAGGQFFESVQVSSDALDAEPTQTLTLLQEDFTGTAEVNVIGTTPDILGSALNGRTWTGSSAIDFNGMGGAVNAGLETYQALTFDITDSYTTTDVLRLTVELKNDQNRWAAIGFSTNNFGGSGNTIGWANVFGDGSTSPGSGSLWEGIGIAGSSDSLATGLWNTGVVNTVVVEYYLADDGDGDGRIVAYVNGTLAAVLADTSLVGMPHSIHLALNNVGGIVSNTNQYFDHVKLEVVREIDLSTQPEIIGLEQVSGGVLKMTIYASAPSSSFPKFKSDLVNGASWSSVAHSIDGSAPFIATNLTYSTASGSDKVIYLEADAATRFYRIEVQ